MVHAALLPLGLAALAAALPMDLSEALETVEKRQVSCVSGLYIIAARGSTEPQGEGPLSAVAQMIEAQVPDSTDVAVVYPAAIISSDSVYPESVVDGINNTTQMIADYVNACGESSQIALLGYSQGGNIMTDLLAGGVDKPAPLNSTYSPYIKGVAVFGDPTFTLGQSFDQGNSTGNGIFSRGGDSLALLNDYAGILRSYCDYNDIVCGGGDSLNVHYNEVSVNAQAAANFISSLMQ